MHLQAINRFFTFFFLNLGTVKIRFLIVSSIESRDLQYHNCLSSISTASTIDHHPTDDFIRDQLSMKNDTQLKSTTGQIVEKAGANENTSWDYLIDQGDLQFL